MPGPMRMFPKMEIQIGSLVMEILRPDKKTSLLYIIGLLSIVFSISDLWLKSQLCFEEKV